MPTDDPALQAFEEAKQEFRKKLKAPQIYKDILKITSVDEVYKETRKIQEEITPPGQLHHLARIKPLLDRLVEYAAVIEVFVQVKPEVLALVWGPIKLLLLWSSKVREVLDAMVDALASVGHALPHFATLARTFETNDVIKTALALFYGDILDFYAIAIEVCRKKRWEQMFDVIWPKYRDRITRVIDNLKKHTSLLTNEVTFLDIQQAKEARDQQSEHMRQTQTFEQEQKFLGLKARVSPNSYDRQLDRIRNRAVAGCAKWLLEDAEFGKWLDASQATILFLWLQGIPGAGKTYLAAATIEHTRERHRTLFAFVSHSDKSTLSALSIFHSLMFQAAEYSKTSKDASDEGYKTAIECENEFCSLLVEAKERELQGSTEYAVHLLKTFLQTAGPTHIIIDGIDEMEQQERQVLLRKCQKLSQDCTQLRLLISSRTEEDVSRILEGMDQTSTIRVDARNSGSIQAYVNHRSQNWMNEQRFDPDVKSELLMLISPLSAKAKGMFLYARIVLDNVQHMGSVEEIQEELKALPEDLPEAYHRIFRRISHLNPRLRKKCQTILSWIGCAPTPLTALEMEQALSIDPDRTKEIEDIPQCLTNINFVQICGPIVEIEDEKLQFVHFTAEEYAFSSQVELSLDKSSAAESLTLVLLCYLQMILLEEKLNAEGIQKSILAGKYRLFQYMRFFWPVLIHQIGNDGATVSHIRHVLEKITEQGGNDAFDFTEEISHVIMKSLQLRPLTAQAHDMVCATSKFYLNEKRWDWNLGNEMSWANLDPLTTSHAFVRIQSQHETLASSSKHLALMHRHYGFSLFRCTYAFCPHSYRGFQSKKDRDSHVKNHNKPWKCSIRLCEFAIIGFSSKSTRDEHWLRLHVPSSSTSQIADADFQNLDDAEAQPLLFSLMLADNIDGVTRLLSSPGGRKLQPEVIAAARKFAVKEGSLALTQLLAPPDEAYVPPDVVISAIKSEEANVVEWALQKAAPEDSNKFIRHMIQVQSDEIYGLWEQYFSAVPGFEVCHVFSKFNFGTIKDNPLQETRVRQAIRKLKGHVGPEELGPILVQVARTSCSTVLAEDLLGLGAPINFPRDTRVGLTALQAAARNTSKEAAFFMKFLIYQGADPRPHFGRTPIGKERGARQIADWLGWTWDELLDEYQRTLR